MAAALTVGAFAGVGDAGEIRHEFEGTNLDPITEVLGVDTVEQKRAFQTSLHELPADAPERAAMGDAIDELYERVVARHDLSDVRRAWQECMVKAGVKAADPFEAEELGAGAASVDCSDATAHLLDPFLKHELAGWADENAEVINAYAAALGMERE